MKIIVGLGNPGEKYRANRHNVGFMLIDYQIQNSKGKTQKLNSKFKSEIIKLEDEKQEMLLLKPQLFMNQSGNVLSEVIRYYKEDINNMYVVHDDLDLRLGEYKIQFGKGPKLHYGVQSIEDHLKTKDFWRIRIGVDNRDPKNRIPGESYVLMNFSKEEKEILSKVFAQIQTELLRKIQ